MGGRETSILHDIEGLHSSRSSSFTVVDASLSPGFLSSVFDGSIPAFDFGEERVQTEFSERSKIV